jgi:hypothetical protein
LTLPAAHDAGMYPPGFLGWGRTQTLSIYDQLYNGVRWFDLRPTSAGSGFILHHGCLPGPSLDSILADVKRFAQTHPHELVLLKFSHFKLTSEKYGALARQITDALGPWLFDPPPGGKRLADVTLREYVASGTKVLVLVDENYAFQTHLPGIWVYSDWNSDYLAQADLRVFDEYANTSNLKEMKADQFKKFCSFNGKCKDKQTDCDLFLLSWTMTPWVRIWAASKPALDQLQSTLATRPPQNAKGKIINLLYVDFVDYARVTETAILQNKRLDPMFAPRPPR